MTLSALDVYGSAAVGRRRTSVAWCVVVCRTSPSLLRSSTIGGSLLLRTRAWLEWKTIHARRKKRNAVGGRPSAFILFANSKVGAQDKP